MNKNWLIRTRQNQVLGPVSREKIIELVEKGTIDPNDEICSGNGYWFYVKEKELLDLFLYQNQSQDYNPVSEVVSILSVERKEELKTAKNQLEDVEEEDVTFLININELEGSDIEDVEEDESPNIDINVDDDNAGSNKYPISSDLDYPDMNSIEILDSNVEEIKEFKVDPIDSNVENIHHTPDPQEVVLDSGMKVLLPSDDDLEYPDIGSNSSFSPLDPDEVDELDEIPDVSEEVSIDMSQFASKQDSSSNEELIDQNESDHPGNMSLAERERILRKERLESKLKGNKAPELPIPDKEAEASDDAVDSISDDFVEESKNDYSLFFVVGLIVVALIAIIYYYFKVLKKPISSVEISSVFISKSYAVEVPDVGILKKKVKNTHHQILS